jgi:hypothetical protein
MGSNVAYRGLLIVGGIVAVGAVLFGSYGLYTTLTGGTNAGDAQSMLGEYQCEEFPGDPEIAHESAFESPRTVVGDSYLAAFNASSTATGSRIEVQTDGPLVNASAREADGTAVEVERIPQENRVVITGRDSTPFRLFLDSVSEDRAVRTELDVCPPE